jgi:STE24 endopeptidase
MMVVQVFNIAFMFKVFDLLLNNRELNRSILANMGFGHESVFISLVIFSKLYETISWFTSLSLVMLSRRFEFQADQFAGPKYKFHLAKALIKVHVKNASNLNPDPLYASLTFSHPQLTERIKALGYENGQEFQSLLDEQEKAPENTINN